MTWAVESMSVEELREEVCRLRDVRAALGGVLAREGRRGDELETVADTADRRRHAVERVLVDLVAVVLEFDAWGSLEVETWSNPGWDGVEASEDSDAVVVVRGELVSLLDTASRAVAAAKDAEFNHALPLTRQGLREPRSGSGSLVSPQHLAGCPTDAGNPADEVTP